MSDISLSKAVRSNLLSLQSTAEMMAKTQERLATGNKVNSALDNPTNFFTASSLNSRAGDLNSLMDSMSNGVKTLEAADNGLTSITKTLESMQSTLRQARQDKSFLNNIYEVTADSVLTVDGGQFTLPTDVKLGTATPGTKAELKTIAAGAYHGPNVTSAASETGTGARTLISNSTGLVNGSVIKVAGVDVPLSGGVTDIELADQIRTALNTVGAPTANKYTVSVGAAGSPNENQVIIETVDPMAEAATVTFSTNTTAATQGSTSFNYTAISSAVTVGGQTVDTGATFEEFVANLEAKATVGGYTVHADPATKDIKLTNVAVGASAPIVAGIPPNVPGVARVDTITIGGATVAGETVTLDGQTHIFVGGTAAQSAAEIRAWINTNPELSAKYGATGLTDKVILTAKSTATGTAAAAAPALATNSTTLAPSAAAATQAGTDAISGFTPAPGTAGASTKTVAAEKDSFSVTYDGKTANIAIGAVKGGGAAANAIEIKDWQDATIAKVNADLKTAGITGVEAKFGSDGKFSIVAKDAEAKSIAISGTPGSNDATALFGNATVSTGTATVDGYSSSAPVDKFVEEINRTFAGKLRASNDNGKLRVENLSTKELNVSFDADGAGVGSPVASKIAGNSVRTGLASQFNELRDQLDKLADDASFNGINLLRGDNLKITFNESGNSFIDVRTADGKGITSSTLDLQNLIGTDLDTDSGIDGLLSEVKLALSSIRSQASNFGSNLSIVQNRQDFTKQMINTLQTGAANLTLADMNEEAANLLALQTRQSLSSSSLSLASQADQSVLKLLQ